jgi:hypothetical protein
VSMRNLLPDRIHHLIQDFGCVVVDEPDASAMRREKVGHASPGLAMAISSVVSRGPPCSCRGPCSSRRCQHPERSGSAEVFRDGCLR